MVLWDIFLLLLAACLGILLLFIRSFQNNIILPGNNISSSSRSVRIILPTGGSGLYQDAEIYQEIIPGSYIIQVDRNSPDTHPEAMIEADVNLYLESIHGSSFFPSREKWLMVNQEYFFPSYVGMVDVLFAKTRYAENLLREYVNKLGAKTRVVYTGHTSLISDEDRPLSSLPSHKKSWHIAVHFAGKSRQKGTRQLIRLWQENLGFRHLIPNSQLIITCRDGCFDKISDDVMGLPRDENGWYDPITGLTVRCYLSPEEMTSLSSSAGLFICPSFVEGYGHYINEGTAQGAIVATTNFPPMNELVPAGNPFLIDPEFTMASWEFMEPFGFIEPYIAGKHLPTSQGAFPNFDHLAEIITGYYLMSDDEKAAWGEKNRKHYLERREEFQGNLSAFFK